MTIDEVLAHWANDSQIDETNLIQTSLEIGKLHSKYVGLYTETKLALHTLTAKFKNLSRLKFEYYSGDLDQETLKAQNWPQWSKRVARPDLQTYVDSDEQIVKATLTLAKQQELVDLLKEILKIVHNRSFHINNAIAMKKFLAGIGGSD